MASQKKQHGEINLVDLSEGVIHIYKEKSFIKVTDKHQKAEEAFIG